MLSLFGFGKKLRKSSKKSVRPRRKAVSSKKLVRRSRKVVKKSVKPSSKVIKMCKKLKVKVTMKRGSKRVYKSEEVLVKQCKLKLKKLKNRKN